jgi:hypothetical protein|tara:strand:- start:535 stop:798 length:264 start_codon:yes stop_codon:yes gene_type:complete
MKIFIYKLLISFIAIFILFQLTVGLLIKETKKTVKELSSKESVISIKEKIRNEIKSGLLKENILNKEDALLLKQFYKKIKKELESSN